MNLLDDCFPSSPPLTRRFNALSTLSLLALHKQSGALGLEMELCCFPCGQKPARIPKKSNRGSDQADAEPAGGGNRLKNKKERRETTKNNTEKARYPGKKPICVFTVKYLIFGHWLFPSGQCLHNLFIEKTKINMCEHAEVGGARKPREGPQNPEKARKKKNI